MYKANGYRLMREQRADGIVRSRLHQSQWIGTDPYSRSLQGLADSHRWKKKKKERGGRMYFVNVDVLHCNGKQSTKE